MNIKEVKIQIALGVLNKYLIIAGDTNGKLITIIKIGSNYNSALNRVLKQQYLVTVYKVISKL